MSFGNPNIIPTITGVDGDIFSITSVEQVNLYTIKITFNQIPKIYSDSATDDALYPKNYLLSGPGNNAITLATPVSADSFSIYIYLQNNISPGDSWELSINSTLLDVLNTPISGQLNWNFTGKVFNLDPILAGVEQETAEQFLRKNISPVLQGPTWNALIAALANNEQELWDNSKLAFNQLFTATASDKYLLDRGADVGVFAPKNMGFSDELFRRYIIQITNKKLTLPALNEILNIFYGDDSTKGFAESSNSETFALSDGDDLDITIDGQFSTKVIFQTSDFTLIASAKAIEVSYVINKYFDDSSINAFAIPYFDANTNSTKLRIYSGNFGVNATVRITGGKAQNILLLNDLVDCYTLPITSLPVWNITKNITKNTIRFSSTTASTSLDLSKVKAGQYVNIFGTEFNTSNRGSFPIVNVSVVFGPFTQYFEIVNLAGVVENVTQLSENSMLFFEPTTRDIYSANAEDAAFAVQSMDGEIDAVLPATSIAVVREEFTGSYLQNFNTYEANGSIVTGVLDGSPPIITISSSFAGDLVDSTVLIDNPICALDPAPIFTGNSLGAAPWTSNYSWTSFWSKIHDSPSNVFDTSTATLGDGSVVFTGGTTSGGGSTIGTQRFILVDEILKPDGIQYKYKWSNSTTMLHGRYKHGISVISGQVTLVTGGETSGGTPGTVTNTAEIVNFDANASVAVTNMAHARWSHRQITLEDGKILVLGGYDSSSNPLKTVELYDPTTNIWTSQPDMSIARAGDSFFAFSIGNSTVVVFGNDSPNNAIYTETYHIGDSGWIFAGNKEYSAYGAKAFQRKNGDIICVGGSGSIAGQSTSPGPIYATEIFSPKNGFWTSGPRLIGEDDTLNFDPTTITGAIMNPVVSDNSTGDFDNISFERILVWSNANASGFTSDDTRFVQYLEYETIPKKNMIGSIKWKKGPDIPSPNSTQLYSATPAYGKASVLIWACGKNPSLIETAGALIYNFNSDQWGYSKLNAAPLKSHFNSHTFIEIPGLTQFSNDYFVLNSADLVFAQAPDNDGIAGPYIWDPTTGIQVADPVTTLTQDIFAGNQYPQITVLNTGGFPSSGYLIFNFGYDNATFPVKYELIVDTNTFKIDSSFIFKYDYLISDNVSVSYAPQTQPFDGNNAEQYGSLYLTDSPAGLAAALSALDQIVAGGTQLNTNILYPGTRGLGGEAFPNEGDGKVSDAQWIWGEDDD